MTICTAQGKYLYFVQLYYPKYYPVFPIILTQIDVQTYILCELCVSMISNTYLYSYIVA